MGVVVVVNVADVTRLLLLLLLVAAAAAAVTAFSLKRGPKRSIHLSLLRCGTGEILS